MKAARKAFSTFLSLGIFLVFGVFQLCGCRSSHQAEQECPDLIFTFSEYDPNEVYPKIPPTEKRKFCGTVTVSIEPESEYPDRLGYHIRLSFQAEINHRRECEPMFFFSIDGVIAGAGLAIEHLSD